MRFSRTPLPDAVHREACAVPERTLPLRWKRRFESCSALRYGTACRARDFSSLSAFLADLALIGHSPDPLPVRPCTGEAGALRWWPGCVVPAVVATTA